MNRLASLWRLTANFYVSAVLLAALGIGVGYLVFFQVFPGKPKIAIIDIPFTVISDDSAFGIGAHLDFAREDDSIKAVVIKLTSPGGGAAASEKLFFETRSLGQKKPVVMVMNDLMASGGYMMSLGANYTFAKPSSFVGNIGVILSPLPPLVPSPPDERVAFTGPFKLGGGSRRDFIGMTDQLKQSFALLVLTQRGTDSTYPRKSCSAAASTRASKGDDRVPMYVKIIPVLLLLYLTSPIDLVPDFIPVLGYLDDVVIALLALALIIRLTSGPVVLDLLQRAKLADAAS